MSEELDFEAALEELDVATDLGRDIEGTVKEVVGDRNYEAIQTALRIAERLQSGDFVVLTKGEWHEILNLTRLIEECGEVTQAACKSIRFGSSFLNPQTHVKNEEELNKECADLSVVMEDATDCDTDRFITMRQQKRDKVHKWKKKERNTKAMAARLIEECR